MISLKKKASGLKIPFLAISIIPLEEIAPIATPKLARIIMFLKEITLDPIAEFKKLTAFFEDIPALTYNLEFDCVKCGHHNEIELRGMDNFFG